MLTSDINIIKHLSSRALRRWSPIQIFKIRFWVKLWNLVIHYTSRKRAESTGLERTAEEAALALKRLSKKISAFKVLKRIVCGRSKFVAVFYCILSICGDKKFKKIVGARQCLNYLYLFAIKRRCFYVQKNIQNINK